MMTLSQSKELRRKINILHSVYKHGGNSRSKILRHTGLDWRDYGYIFIDEMINDGYLYQDELKGARSWIILTPKGRELLDKWSELRGLLYGVKS